MKNKDTQKKIFQSFSLVIVLLIALTVSTYALVIETESILNNKFRTGYIKLSIICLDKNLNPVTELSPDGEVINDAENTLKFVGNYVDGTFEPGMTLRSYFKIAHKSSDDIYYGFYFDLSNNAHSTLPEVVDIKIIDYDTNEVVSSGIMANMLKENIVAVDQPLTLSNTEKTFILEIHFAESAGNEYQNKDGNGYLKFKLCARATQVRNNDDRRFD